MLSSQNVEVGWWCARGSGGDRCNPNVHELFALASFCFFSPPAWTSFMVCSSFLFCMSFPILFSLSRPIPGIDTVHVGLIDMQYECSISDQKKPKCWTTSSAHGFQKHAPTEPYLSSIPFWKRNSQFFTPLSHHPQLLVLTLITNTLKRDWM